MYSLIIKMPQIFTTKQQQKLLYKTTKGTDDGSNTFYFELLNKNEF